MGLAETTTKEYSQIALNLWEFLDALTALLRFTGTDTAGILMQITDEDTAVLTAMRPRLSAAVEIPVEWAQLASDNDATVEFRASDLAKLKVHCESRRRKVERDEQPVISFRLYEDTVRWYDASGLDFDLYKFASPRWAINLPEGIHGKIVAAMDSQPGSDCTLETGQLKTIHDAAKVYKADVSLWPVEPPESLRSKVLAYAGPLVAVATTLLPEPDKKATVEGATVIELGAARTVEARPPGGVA